MAQTKVTAEQLKKLIKLGIKSKTDVESARKELIKKLGEKDVDGVDKDSLEELIEMYEAFFEADEEEEEEVEEESDEEESDEDELAEEADEEEEEEVAPKKKSATKPEVKKSAKPEVKSTKTTKKSTEKFTPWTSDDDDNKKALKAITKLFPKAEIKWLKQGLTIFFPGKSSKRAVISFDRIKFAADGSIVGDLFFNALKGKEEVYSKLGEDREFKFFNANLLFLSKLSIDDVLEILDQELIDYMTKKLTTADGRALKNREKLEEKIKGDKKSSPKAKAVVEDEDEEEEEIDEEDEEEEEEEEVAPKKVVKKAAPVVTKNKKK